jgi:DNA (cytosine-5)-methyltransferase 1
MFINVFSSGTRDLGVSSIELLVQSAKKRSDSAPDIFSCVKCERDRRFLTRSTRPSLETGALSVNLADLFCGGGFLSLGISEAFRRLKYATNIELAVEREPIVAEAFRENFPDAKLHVGNVEDLFDGELGARLTSRERLVKRSTKRIDVLLGGPPCQGHSDLNNHTRRDDPRNLLYVRVARAAEVLEPQLVFIENVPSVVNDRSNVVDHAISTLKKRGYNVAAARLSLADFGIPQRRKRHFVVAIHRDCKASSFPHLLTTCSKHQLRPLTWAIGDLENVTFGESLLDRPSTATAVNQKRIDWLFDNSAYDLPNRLRPSCHRGDHTYRSMYGRLRWDMPAQTITTGFGSMGQGRFVHPSQRRVITPHEAARIQTIPDFYRFKDTRRTTLAEIIGNAVPPLVGPAFIDILRLITGDYFGEVGEQREQSDGGAFSFFSRGAEENAVDSAEEYCGRSRRPKEYIQPGTAVQG